MSGIATWQVRPSIRFGAAPLDHDAMRVLLIEDDFSWAEVICSDRVVRFLSWWITGLGAAPRWFCKFPMIIVL